MPRLHDNYYQRKYYLKNNQVPTQTVMKNKMQLPLAMVYFKSMTSKLKVYAGLEPPMKGGGADWFMPPDELLAGRAVLKPIDHDLLNKIGFNGIDHIGEIMNQRHFKVFADEEFEALQENDFKWKKKIAISNRVVNDSTSRAQVLTNAAEVRTAFNQFELFYRQSTTMLDEIIFNATVKEIQSTKEETYQKMNEKYKKFLKHQQAVIHYRHKQLLLLEKERLKNEFISNVEEIHTNMGKQIHDIKVEKHIAIEKLRNVLECQNLACQVYVGLKEREACKKEIELLENDHKKKLRQMTEEIIQKDNIIYHQIREEEKRKEFNMVWRRKICHVVKKFQMFVEYCLKMLPQHAEFFTNMEKLMLLQLNEASENPSTESIIQTEQGQPRLAPEPHPFFLCCDRGYYPRLDQNLCPKHCTSSASQFPVIVVNKKLIYAACDNFEMFSDKVKEYVGGQRGSASVVVDDHDYTHDVPVKFTSKTDVQELKLESSLMQVLQRELRNIRGVPLDCPKCKIPYCFCGLKDHTSTAISLPKIAEVKVRSESKARIPLGTKLQPKEVLKLQREPKWESYMDFIIPRKCECGKRAKKHLEEHLPPYMRKMSPYAAPELPNYVPCPVIHLQKLVKEAKGIRTPPPPPPKVPSKTRDVGTQYSDEEFNFLCNCFSEDEINKIFKSIKGSEIFDLEKTRTKKPVVDGSMSACHLQQTASSFATTRADSLRRLIADIPELKEIFKREKCDY